MFASLRISIFIYYFITVVLFINLSYYFLVILQIENFYIFGLIVLCFVILSGIFISKLAVDPLAEYVHNLQNLSKETLHELNLPISTIVSNTQILRENSENEKNFKRLSRIESACVMLQERYNELDYMIKMQSKESVKELFYLDELIRKRVLFLQKLYPHILFELELEHLEILGDTKGLAKVIDNLIDNGVKYSQNSKKIDIRLVQNILSVKDYGVGMDEVELLQIFDNYYQSNKEIQGFGIGLSMVKRFCDANEIELTFISKREVGTEVKMEFKTIIGN